MKYQSLKGLEDTRGIAASYDDARALYRAIDYRGPGWYSLDDGQVYRRGKFPTYSRIRIAEVI